MTDAMDYEEWQKESQKRADERRENAWTQLRELNQTPLSQECKNLLKDPSDGGLYLLQALQQAQEENQPSWESRDSKSTQTVWRTTRDLLEEMSWRYHPKTVYLLLTTSGKLDEEEMDDTVLLAEMQKETDPADKLWTLLDWATENLEANGFNLKDIYPTTD